MTLLVPFVGEPKLTATTSHKSQRTKLNFFLHSSFPGKVPPSTFVSNINNYNNNNNNKILSHCINELLTATYHTVTVQRPRGWNFVVGFFSEAGYILYRIEIHVILANAFY